jgi:hypothetical protein
MPGAAADIGKNGEEEMIFRKGVLGITQVALFTLVMAGCGYTTRSMISNKYRTIHIKQFINKIDITRETDASSKYKLYKPSLDTDLTRSVIDKFLFDGNLKPVKEENADLVLKGELVEFRRDSLRTENNEVQEYRVNIVVNLSLWDKKEDRLVWQENSFTGDFTYFPFSSTLPNIVKKGDDQAVNEAVADLSRRIIERTVEQW